MDIRQAEEIKKRYENFKIRYSKVEAIQDMKSKEAMALINKHGFQKITDYKKVIEKRDSELPKVNDFINQVQEFLSVSEPKLREIEEDI